MTLHTHSGGATIILLGSGLIPCVWSVIQGVNPNVHTVLLFNQLAYKWGLASYFYAIGSQMRCVETNLCIEYRFKFSL